MIGSMDLFRRLFGAGTHAPAPPAAPAPQPAAPVADAPAGPVADPRFPKAWRAVQLAELQRHTSLDGLRPYLQNGDGYVRQAAVEHGSRLDVPGMLTLLIERLNDWVPQVRQATLRALDGALRHVAPAHIIAALPAAYRLAQAGRTAHGAWIAHFEQTALARAGNDALVAALGHADIHVARAACRLLADTGALDAEALFCAVIPASHDVVLASLAFAHLDRHAGGIGDSLLMRAMQSPLTAIRVRALERLLQDGAVHLPEGALLARQSQLRRVAKRFIAQQGADVAGLYAEALRAPGNPHWKIIVCLLELGQSRQVGYLGQVRGFLAHPEARVREAATLAWLHLAPAAKDEIALSALADPAPRLHKLALKLVRKHGAYLPFSQVQALLAAPAHWRSLLAFAASQPWDWLDTIAALAQAPHLAEPGEAAGMQDALLQELRAWTWASGRLSIPPSVPQRARIAAAAAGLLALAHGQSWHPQLRQVLAAFDLAD